MTQDTEAERFTEWFRQNYPGPDTIIGRPDWHAPKIYRAATHEMRKQLDEARAERDALLRCVTDNHDALCRAEKAEAERNALLKELTRCVVEMESVRVFVTSREKVKHPEGTELYDEVISAARAALTGEAKP